LETAPRSAISSMEAPWKPRSANTDRATPISCSRRSGAVIRTRRALLVTVAPHAPDVARERRTGP